MGVHRSILITEANKLLSNSLQELGYVLNPSPPESIRDEFWFENRTNDPAYKIIEFQPSGFDETDLFDMAVNLGYGIKPDNPLDYDFFRQRLASWLWDLEGALDGWWHFTTIEEVQVAYLDILDKLLKYGIPYLENPEEGMKKFNTRVESMRAKFLREPDKD